MIKALISLIDGFSRLLEACAKAEQKQTERKLSKASALVTEANAHRKAANFARKVASGLRDIQAS